MLYNHYKAMFIERGCALVDSVFTSFKFPSLPPERHSLPTRWVIDYRAERAAALAKIMCEAE